MALIKYGGGIVQMSGSIAGDVHARNRFGNYTRSRTKPVNPKSTRQVLIRECLANLVQRWRATLTAGQRTAWATYAAAVAMNNRLGETVYLTGFNHYLRGNIVALMEACPPRDDGPTDLALPEQDPTFAIAASVASQKITVTFDEDLPWTDEVNSFLLIEMGEPQNATRNFFNGPWRRTAILVPVDTSPKEVDPCFTLVLGQKIWCYGRIFRADARLSQPFRASCTVSA